MLLNVVSDACEVPACLPVSTDIYITDACHVVICPSLSDNKEEGGEYKVCVCVSRNVGCVAISSVFLSTLTHLGLK